ncbi:MAG: hypothetical protein DRP37_07295, partial [Thermodesulfobacteriota bacterium]
MRGLKLTVFLLVIMAIVVPQVSRAGEKETGVMKLDEIVVSATKTEKSIEDAPGSVSVISSEDIEMRNIQTVDEALSEVRGRASKSANFLCPLFGPLLFARNPFRLGIMINISGSKKWAKN